MELRWGETILFFCFCSLRYRGTGIHINMPYRHTGTRVRCVQLSVPVPVWNRDFVTYQRMRGASRSLVGGSFFGSCIVFAVLF